MSVPRYTVAGDGLQDDPHGFLARWYDFEKLQAENARLSADLAAASERADGLARALALGVDEMCEGWCGGGGRGQFVDCFGCRLAALAALPSGGAAS